MSGIYLLGYGIERDERKAAACLQAAVDRRHVKAHFWLGTLYMKGQGVRKDAKMARMLLHWAAVEGDEEARLQLLSQDWL